MPAVTATEKPMARATCAATAFAAATIAFAVATGLEITWLGITWHPGALLAAAAAALLASQPSAYAMPFGLAAGGAIVALAGGHAGTASYVHGGLATAAAGTLLAIAVTAAAYRPLHPPGRRVTPRAHRDPNQPAQEPSRARH